MKADKKIYNEYIKNLTQLLKNEEFYSSYSKNIICGNNAAKIISRHNNNKFDTDWVDIIEGTLISLDTIVRNPRKFIVIEEDIIDISLAKSITTESVKHLAQHTNLISSVDKNGMVLPNKILNTTKEESYEVYENRFIYTLLLKLKDFINKRFDLIKKAYSVDEMIEVNLKSSFNLGKTKMQYKMDLIAAMPPIEIKKDNNSLTEVERVAKIDRIVTDFLGSSFAKQMVSSALVRPPIQRTNVILKNTDFKKALMLWQFIETYDKTGFYSENQDTENDLDEASYNQFLDLGYLNTLLFDSITDVSNIFQNEIKGESLLPDIKPYENENAQQPEDSTSEQKTEKSEEKAEAVEEDKDNDLKNIDFNINEIRNIYEKNPDDKTVTKTEIKKTNFAIDRVLFKIKAEKAKADKVRLFRLKEKEKKKKERFLKAVANETKALKIYNRKENKKESEKLLKQSKSAYKEVKISVYDYLKTLIEIKKTEFEKNKSLIDSKNISLNKSAQNEIEKIEKQIILIEKTVKVLQKYIEELD